MTVENRKVQPVAYNPEKHGPLVFGTQTGNPAEGKADVREWVVFGK